MTILRQPALEGIGDLATRESIQWILDYLSNQPLLSGQFQHFELEFNKIETNLKVPHSLGFQPLDVIQTSIIPASGIVTCNMARFTSTNLDVTTNGACVVRFFVGRYSNAQ